MPHRSRLSFTRLLIASLALLFVAGLGQSYAARYNVGSQNTTYADPYVPRPGTKPCVVTLFSNVAFDNFNPYNFNYTPPSDCTGPWQKVVFAADISVTKGIQYDRTANFWIGGANIYFGTTAEPSPQHGPYWHVESDLTDYSPLFTAAQNGQADIGNLVNDQYTGVIYASAKLFFYPIDSKLPAPKPFNVVLPMSAGPDGGTVTISPTNPQLAQTFTLPTNITGAYLDVYAQSQGSNDEFWYTCVPNNLTSELESCGNTAFREGEVTIDGQPAGVSPIYPWIFTGGIDPFLWFPLPGVQTLNFTPYRVNLTPFVGLLSNGQPHTVALSVFNAEDFSATATLLLNTDPNVSQVTGWITKNNLHANPSPKTTADIKNSNGDVTGTVSITSQRTFTIAGYAVTSAGMVTTKVNQSVNFSNQQGFIINNNEYMQSISQATDITSTTTQVAGGVTTKTFQQSSYPLVISITDLFNSNGTVNQITTAQQENYSNGNVQVGAHQVSAYTRDNVVSPTDNLLLTGQFQIISNSDQSSSQHYVYFDSTGKCYDLALAAANNKLTSFTYNCDNY
ncbi:MAG TPA: peptide-N4-asparagine amidase [Terriglobales bacterium]